VSECCRPLGVRTYRSSARVSHPRAIKSKTSGKSSGDDEGNRSWNSVTVKPSAWSRLSTRNRRRCSPSDNQIPCVARPNSSSL